MAEVLLLGRRGPGVEPLVRSLGERDGRRYIASAARRLTIRASGCAAATQEARPRGVVVVVAQGSRRVQPCRLLGQPSSRVLAAGRAGVRCCERRRAAARGADDEGEHWRHADDGDRAFAREWDAVLSSAWTVVVGEGKDSSDSACTGHSSFVKRARAENRARPLYPLCFLPFSAQQTLAFTEGTIKYHSRQGKARQGKAAHVCSTLCRSSVRVHVQCADSLSPSPALGLMERLIWHSGKGRTTSQPARRPAHLPAQPSKLARQSRAVTCCNVCTFGPNSPLQLRHGAYPQPRDAQVFSFPAIATCVAMLSTCKAATTMPDNNTGGRTYRLP
jgi:hypothetical protein